MADDGFDDDGFDDDGDVDFGDDDPDFGGDDDDFDDDGFDDGNDDEWGDIVENDTPIIKHDANEMKQKAKMNDDDKEEEWKCQNDSCGFVNKGSALLCGKCFGPNKAKQELIARKNLEEEGKFW
eukprot:CAMPEP_0114676070 /NCGR_PEP_ID=MMETSP0191-20121206/48749_1 /TAXON_ID=126664 /ORGANISM="Sorites sp." /LENGTH=123 /DNA_ID=CAMNT_0001946463 /DNA_START=17 /DNA_END=385 /DNA_ORIENTATION=-